MPTIHKHDEYLTRTFRDSPSFETWLGKNHAKADGIWIKMAKAGTGIRSISHPEALDVALCYGWIDGLRRGLDAVYFLQKFTPRRSKSAWSLINKKKVSQLSKEGRMQEAGLNAIDAAKRDGRWESAYESQKTIAVPGDLQLALDKNRKAKIFFTKLTSQNRYAILYRIGKVKRPETRMRKIGEYVGMLEKGETIYPQ